MAMPFFHLHLSGTVQGVGMRPAIWRMATEMGLKGEVCNAADGVHIWFGARDDAEARAFERRLLQEAPPLAVIARSCLLPEPPGEYYDRFRITPSREGTSGPLLPAPDAALCPDCRRELYDPSSRRYRYPFITCTHCGPRHTLSLSLPFDRETTTLRPFDLCPACAHEYTDPHNRRFHAQTLSCPECAIRLSAETPDGTCLTDEPEAVIALAVKALKAGNILAVKGVGGYLLLCDATDVEAIATLRRRKHRPSKPLAVMYPSLEMLLADADFSRRSGCAPLICAELTSAVAPIVLIPMPLQPASGLRTDALAPGLDEVGAMLPCAPLLDLIACDFGKPVVATSANFSGSPIVFRDDDARRLLCDLADLVVVHNRPIATPMDDSVVRYALDGQRIILRQGRGMVPAGPQLEPGGSPVLAFGADMKAAFGWYDGGQTCHSQYLGDLSRYEAQEHFQHALAHSLHLAPPMEGMSLLADLHPGYFSTQMAAQMAEQEGIPLMLVQHHKAHFAAVLGESHLAGGQEPVLGVIWDGTGMGEDGHLWGGEFFVATGHQMKRVAHLPVIPVLLGDKMARDPRLSALSVFGEQAGDRLQSLFTLAEWQTYGHFRKQPPALLTSSAGRLFDAAAALTGICPRATYEGEAALRLEAAATRIHRGVPADADRIRAWVARQDGGPAQVLCAALDQAWSAAEAAYAFHLAMVCEIAAVAARQQVKRVAFSGGVFQNALLCLLIRETMAPAFDLYFHRRLPPNDACIPFGQMVYVTHYQAFDIPISAHEVPERIPRS